MKTRKIPRLIQSKSSRDFRTLIIELSRVAVVFCDVVTK
jgi:hypothetical protein